MNRGDTQEQTRAACEGELGWLDTISSELGIGTGSYAGSIALEKEMRKEAKTDIARIVNSTAIKPDARAAASFIVHSFEMVFGPRHLSVKCLTRSVIASCIFIGFWIVFIGALSYRSVFEILFIPTIIADYLSLFKGRRLLQMMSMNPTIIKMFCIV